MTAPPLSPEERMAQYVPNPNPVDAARLAAIQQKIIEATVTTPPLSPAAQAVMDAFWAESPVPIGLKGRKCIAAAFRAAANQLPKTYEPTHPGTSAAFNLGASSGLLKARNILFQLVEELSGDLNNEQP